MKELHVRVCSHPAKANSKSKYLRIETNILLLRIQLYWSENDFLVFRRKDLCEAKHDLGMRKMCSKSTLYPTEAYWWGGGCKA